MNLITGAVNWLVGVFKPAPAPKPTPPGVTKPIGTLGPGGLQPTYNPQQTAPSPQQTYNPQGNNYNPQRTWNPQTSTSYAAAQQREIDLAAQRERDRLEAIRLAEIARKEAAKKQFNSVKDEWQAKISAMVAQQRKGPDGFWNKIWDTLTFGQERREINARKFAQQEGERESTDGVQRYEKSVNDFYAEQARRKQQLEASKFTTQAQFDAANSEFQKWQEGEINRLRYAQDAITGMLAGYGQESTRPLDTPAAKALTWFNKNVSSNPVVSNIWKYTLGEGDKNAPSLVTAPGRIINSIGNWLNPNHQVNLEGGAAVPQKTLGNPWQASWNQRSFNMASYGPDEPFDRDKAKKQFFGESNKWQIDAFNKLSPAEQDKRLRQEWAGMQFGRRATNNFLDFALDPLNLAGGGKFLASGAVKAPEWAPKALKVFKLDGIVGWGAKTGNKISDAATAFKSRVAANPLVAWLGAEHKTRDQQLFDAIDAARKAQAGAQDSILPQVRRIAAQLGVKKQLDYDVLDEFGKLTDSEAAILQRMVGGKLSFKDRALLAGKGMAPTRKKLEDLSARYLKFSEQMAEADSISKGNRFRQGFRQYFARTNSRTKPLDTYDFRKQKLHNVEQTAADLHRSQVERLFKSNLESFFAEGQHANSAKLQAKLKQLMADYDAQVMPARQAVDLADARANNFAGRTQRLWNKIGPTALWKKSVLKYRPAWYVNNVLYNVPASTLAGGPRALLEHGKLLNPRYWRKALDEVPAEVKSNLARETGSGVTPIGRKVGRFASRLENWSRVAAFKAAKSRGLTDEAALKRVNRYLFDYSTKNWERPFKAVLPFWSFQKNLTKAAVVMPFDRPTAALALHGLDRYQNEQFDKDFETLRPQLKAQGFTDAEIDQEKEARRKYYQGRLKIGSKYWTTPFNAFSEKGLNTAGINPFLQAAGETSSATDRFGRPLAGDKATFFSTVTAKFPQVKLAQDWLGRDVKNVRGWIGAAGHDGFGLTKQRQGFDKSKPNYDPTMDPKVNLSKDWSAFLGAPNGLEFDKNRELKQKTFEKVTAEYFGTKFSDNFAERTKQEDAIFARHGVTADEFFNGELAKWDSDATKRIKALKSDAQKKTEELFAEYGRQPAGTRNMWATKKLKELVDRGYFAENPFLRSFDWTNPTTIARAYKQIAYASKPHGPSAKKIAYDRAKATGDWTEYVARYGSKFAHSTKTPHVSPAEAKFWAQYAAADKATRRQLLADNPQYNHRANWTQEQWDAANAGAKAKTRAKLLAFAPAAANYAANTTANLEKASEFASRRRTTARKPLVWA